MSELTARQQKVNNYSAHLSEVLAAITASPGAATHPESVKAATDQMNQWNEYAFFNDIDAMTEAEFAEYIGYGDDVNQAMNEILYNLTPAGTELPAIADKKPGEMSAGAKLAVGAAVVGGIALFAYFMKASRIPGLGGLGSCRSLGNYHSCGARGLGALKFEDRDSPVGPMTWENRFGFGPRDVESMGREYKYLPHKETMTGPQPAERGGAHSWRTNSNEEVVARLLKTKEWRGSTAVDMGDVIEVRHPGGAVARIVKKRPEKKRGRR